MVTRTGPTRGFTLAILGRTPLAAGGRDCQPDHMEAVEITTRQSGKDGAVTPALRFVVIVGEPADGGSASRIEEPDRLLRVWALLQATSEQLDAATLPPEGIPGLQRQIQVIHSELERAVSPPLAAELRRILPSHDAIPSAGALRIECAVLLSWVGSLVVQTLAVLAAAHERLQHVGEADHWPRAELAPGRAWLLNAPVARSLRLVPALPDALGWLGSCSALLLVLERELQLGPEGDRAALVHVDVLLDHLGHPEVVEGLARGLHRLRRRVFP